MTVRSILTHIDSATPLDGVVAAASALARRFDAHVSAVAWAYEPDITVFAGGPVVGEVVVQQWERARQAAMDLKARAEAAFEREGVRFDVSFDTCVRAQFPARFGAYARFADLVVVAPPAADLYEGDAAWAVEGAMFDADAPVYLTPVDAATPTSGPVLIGWNGSREALRAAKAATPFLQTAEIVQIALFDPETTEEASAKMLATALERRGVRVEVSLAPVTSGAVSEAIDRRAADLGAELVVLGAYSHSRFREMMIGGVTRDLLGDVSRPLFLAH